MPEDEEERELQEALWLSSQQQQPYDTDLQCLQLDHGGSMQGVAWLVILVYRDIHCIFIHDLLALQLQRPQGQAAKPCCCAI